MRHFLLMVMFAGLVAVPFSFFGREHAANRVRYGVKIFLEFTLVGLAISWALFLLP